MSTNYEQETVGNVTVDELIKSIVIIVCGQISPDLRDDIKTYLFRTNNVSELKYAIYKSNKTNKNLPHIINHLDLSKIRCHINSNQNQNERQQNW